MDNFLGKLGIIEVMNIPHFFGISFLIIIIVSLLFFCLFIWFTRWLFQIDEIKDLLQQINEKLKGK